MRSCGGCALFYDLKKKEGKHLSKNGINTALLNCKGREGGFLGRKKRGGGVSPKKRPTGAGGEGRILIRWRGGGNL